MPNKDIKNIEGVPEEGNKVVAREITTELRESYLDYAMSVIVGRALPDARDGLKPVHRRILWAMWDSGLTHSAKQRKSANVVGEVLGRYHPHGDQSVYDAMTRMAQDFSLRYPLIQGQGNWGSIDGDNAAAMRYCLTGDSLVVTNKGLMPIDKISEDESEDIDIKILSKDRTINKATKWFDSGEHPTIRIETQQGFSIQGSYNHPVLIWNKNDNHKLGFKWKLLSEIAEGDVAVLDRTADLLWPDAEVDVKKYWPVNKDRRREKKILPTKFTADLAHILGALVSEGCIKTNKIEFCNGDKEWINEFEKRWAIVFPDCRLHKFDKKPSSYGKKPYQILEIHSRYIIEFLRNIGLAPVKSQYKKIPQVVMQSPKSVVTAFLSAYFEGDGSISYSSKMTELSAISVSEDLIKELQIVLLRLGILGTKRFDKHRNTHKLYIRGLKNYILFKEQINFFSSKKKDKLESAITRLHKDYSQNDYVPFLRGYVEQISSNDSSAKSFITRYNFDRYSNMQKNYGQVVSAVKSEFQLEASSIFRNLLENNYVFDPICKVEKKEVAKVYSIKVDSKCHSFVGNGFINHNTECKLSKISEEMLADIGKETVDFAPNYDGTRKEPVVLPTKIPNLLINGSDGIAVGMATKIPPHNLTEVLDATVHLIENAEATSENLMDFIKGPDFPTGGIIYNRKEIVAAYVSGRGGITIRADVEVEEKRIIVNEIPYQTNKAELIIKMADLVRDKKIEGIKDIRDESDRSGLRIVIELKNDIIPQKILNQLYTLTDLQKDFHLNMLALRDGIKPDTLSIKDVLSSFIDHRHNVVRRRAEFDLERAKERAHILEGLKIALDSIDKIIKTIRGSKDKADAHKNLVKDFKLTSVQADAILEMKLQSLAALERDKVEKELAEKIKIIKELTELLKSKTKLMNVVKSELVETKEKFGDERKTKVVNAGLKEFKAEDLIPEEETVITLSKDGYIKRIPPTTFKVQKRGGSGIIGSDVSESDWLSHLVRANTHDNILFFTNKGIVLQTKVYEIPAGSRTSKGKSIHSFLEISSDSEITAVVTYSPIEMDKRKAQSIVMVTEDGVIKKTNLVDFNNVRRNGIIAIKLKDKDVLRWADMVQKGDELILCTRKGNSIRFKESDVREMGRTAAGVTAIRLKKDDQVSSFNVIRDGENRKLLVVMEKGFAKQTPLKEYKIQKRGGSGIITAKITDKTGELVSSHVISDETELLAISVKGQILRTEIKSIRKTGRSAQGVSIMRLKPGDKIAGTVCL